jgi:hypothetical protein
LTGKLERRCVDGSTTWSDKSFDRYSLGDLIWQNWATTCDSVRHDWYYHKYHSLWSIQIIHVGPAF